MAAILQVLGFLFLLFVLVVILAIYVLKRKLRQLGQIFEGAAASATPGTVTLQPIGDDAWNEPSVAESFAAFEGLGYTRGAAYRPNEIPNLTVLPLANGTINAYGVVYRFVDSDTVWVDVFQRYEDETSITVSNSAHAQGLRHMPGHIKIYLPNESVAEVHRRFMADRPNRAAMPATLEGFKDEFEEAYAREMDWRDANGVSGEEIEAIARNGGTAVDEEVLARTQAEVARQANYRLHDKLRGQFLLTTTLSAAEWEEFGERIVFVHNRLSREELASIVGSAYEDVDEEEIDEEAITFPPGPAREAFAQFNEAATPDHRFRHLGIVEKPIEADVYVAPTGVYAE
ncbi:MAG: hypothetical protein ACO1SV_03765 [Fimbriimonas sp.]